MDRLEELFKLNSEIESMEILFLECIDEHGQIVNEEGIEQLQSAQSNQIAMEGRRDDLLLSIAHSITKRIADLAGIEKTLDNLEKRKKEIKGIIGYYKGIIERVAPQKHISDEISSIKPYWQDKLFVDESILPEGWKRPKYKDNPLVKDSDKIKTALKAGMAIPGCQLKKERNYTIK